MEATPAPVAATTAAAAAGMAAALPTEATMTDRFTLEAAGGGFSILDRQEFDLPVANVETEAMARQIVRLLNDEHRWMSQEPPEATLDAVASTQEAIWRGE